MTKPDVELKIGADSGDVKAEMERLRKEVSRTEREARKAKAQFDSLNNTPLNNIKSKFGGLSNSIGAVSLALTGIAASAAASVTAIMSVARELSDLIDAAERAGGVSTDFFQEVTFAAAQSGIELSTLSSSLEAFNRRLSAARSGRGELATLAKDDVNLDNIIKVADNTQDAFESLMRYLSTLDDVNYRAEVLQAAMSTTGRKLLTMVDGMDELRSSARKTGLIMDENLLRGAKELSDEFDHVVSIISTEFKQAVVSASPYLLGLVKQAKALFAQLFADDKATQVPLEVKQVRSVATVIDRRSYEQLEDLAKRRSEIIRQIGELSAQSGDAMSGAQAVNIDALNSSLDAIDARLASIVKQAASSQQFVKSLDLDLPGGKVPGPEIDLSAIDKQLEDLAKRRSELVSQVGAVKLGVPAVDASELHGELDAIDARLKSLVNESARAQKDIKVNIDVQAGGKVAAPKVDLTAINEQIDELARRRADIAKQLDSVKISPPSIDAGKLDAEIKAVDDKMQSLLASVRSYGYHQQQVQIDVSVDLLPIDKQMAVLAKRRGDIVNKIEGIKAKFGTALPGVQARTIDALNAELDRIDARLPKLVKAVALAGQADGKRSKRPKAAVVDVERPKPPKPAASAPVKPQPVDPVSRFMEQNRSKLQAMKAAMEEYAAMQQLMLANDGKISEAEAQSLQAFFEKSEIYKAQTDAMNAFTSSQEAALKRKMEIDKKMRDENDALYNAMTANAEAWAARFADTMLDASTSFEDFMLSMAKSALKAQATKALTPLFNSLFSFGLGEIMGTPPPVQPAAAPADSGGSVTYNVAAGVSWPEVVTGIEQANSMQTANVVRGRRLGRG